MKRYPSISKEISPLEMVYAFDKLDGNNIRAEISRKKGFYKFGSRKCMIDEAHETLGESVGLIKTKYEKEIHDILVANRWDSMICFFEFYGPRSFAGLHHPDDKRTVTIFDANPHKKGMLEPKMFLKIFGRLDIPRLLYQGPITEEFVESVRKDTLQGMSCEGVICKGKDRKQLVMFKVKTQKWLDKLKTFCGADEGLFLKLS